ncbi:hypothetical protein ACFW2X_08370 [Streptomyces antibioticus]|uniref:hypothetical protein n=1 Tax=Streptomyces antibioticus TaxID=1890 RepID=UPI0036CAB542
MAVSVLLAAGGFTAWRAGARDGRAVDQGRPRVSESAAHAARPLEGRPRVSDAVAGVSYGVPEGWAAGDEEGLIPGFTSSVTRRMDAEGGSTVLAGKGEAVTRDGLRDRAESAARSNAEFFCPDGTSRVEESRAVEVGGRPAHTVVLRTTDKETGGEGHPRLTLVSVDASRSAFLLGVVHPAGTEEAREADAVVESAGLL